VDPTFQGTYWLEMQITSTDPETGLTTLVTTTQHQLIPGQALPLSGYGAGGIGLVTFRTYCQGACVTNLPFAITGMSALQPVVPTLDVQTVRNGDGTYAAVVSYTFPMAGTLTVSLLPTADEAGITYVNQPNVTGSGSSLARSTPSARFRPSVLGAMVSPQRMRRCRGVRSAGHHGGRRAGPAL